jgi:hypothetical protein
VGRGVRLQRAGRPRRAGRQGLPDLAGAALRALQEEAQAAGTSPVYTYCCPGSACTSALFSFRSRACRRRSIG